MENREAGAGPEWARKHDPRAREAWAAGWWPRVYRMAFAMTGRPDDAEDLAQETLMAALGAAARFRGDSSEGTWIYGILLRCRGTMARRRGRGGPRPAAVQTVDPELDEAASLLDGLPDALRITAALFYLEDCSIEEIAGALGVPRATVRWRLFRARGRLRERLAPRCLREDA